MRKSDEASKPENLFFYVKFASFLQNFLKLPLVIIYKAFLILSNEEFQEI